MADNIFQQEDGWDLDEDQQRALNTIVAKVRESGKRKIVIVVVGGPGTGKSLIGMKLLGTFATTLGDRVSYACGNSSFRDNLAGRLTWAVKQREITDDIEFESLFTNFREYHGREPGSYDLIICDEAQRLQPDSSSQYETVQVKQESA